MNAICNEFSNNPMVGLNPDFPKSITTPAQSKTVELIKKIFAEIVVSAIVVGITCLFVATPQTAVAFIVVTVAILAINIIARIAAFYFEKNSCETASKATKWIPPLTFGFLYEITANTLVHEWGHFAAAKSIFTDANPKVIIDGLFGGKTYLGLGRVYTAFGKLLGPLNSMRLIAAAGTLVAIIMATVGLILAIQLRNKHPELSKYFLVAGGFYIIQHVVVALSALTSNPLGGAGNDFLSLWYSGIHPLVSVVCIIAIPLLAILSLLLVNKIRTGMSSPG